MLSEPVHGISDGGVCVASKALDQPAHACSLIGAFACRLSVCDYWAAAWVLFGF